MLENIKLINNDKVFKGYLNRETLEKINKAVGKNITSIYKKPLVINNKIPNGIILIQHIQGNTSLIRLD